MNTYKANGYISLFVVAILFVHSIYELITYILLYYNPIATKLFGYLLGSFVVIHGVLSVINVYVKNDSKKIRYKKLNMKTYLQRISAFCLVVLLPLHIMAFGILQSTAFGTIYVILEVLNSLFYVAVYVHVAISFSKCLITIGVLEDEKKMIIIDRVLIVICSMLCIASVVVSVLTHITMFSM